MCNKLVLIDWMLIVAWLAQIRKKMFFLTLELYGHCN